MLWSDRRVDAHRQLISFYQHLFSADHSAAGLQAHLIHTSDEIDKMVDFFAWTAWTATANRPGYNYSCSNNWPPDELAGNRVTADAVTWSVGRSPSRAGSTTDHLGHWRLEAKLVLIEKQDEAAPRTGRWISLIVLLIGGRRSGLKERIHCMYVSR